MEKNITVPRAIIFDMGGTIEDVKVDYLTYMEGADMIAARLYDSKITKRRLAPEELKELIDGGLLEYKSWAMENGVESVPRDIWVKWLLVDELVSETALTMEMAEWLSFTQETRCLSRELRPEAHEVLTELKKRGYGLGVVSNTISQTQVPYTLDVHDLTRYFQTVQASSVVGSRKPHPKMLQIAADELGVHTSECMYVGDTFSRDILGARAAGYGWALLLSSPDSTRRLPELGTGQSTWEGHITNLLDILDILEQRPWDA